MSETPPEVDLDALAAEKEDERLENSLVAFTIAIGAALKVCSYGLTIGEAYVPFDPDDDDECEDEEATCEQAWVRVAQVTPTGGSSLLDGSECSAVLRYDLEVGILRCVEVPEGGEAPKAEDVLAAAMQSMRDMNAIYRTALATDVWETLVTGTWVPVGPTGGQYGGTWSFSVEI